MPPAAVAVAAVLVQPGPGSPCVAVGPWPQAPRLALAAPQVLALWVAPSSLPTSHHFGHGLISALALLQFRLIRAANVLIASFVSEHPV
jgi:hypothetical protein